MDLLKGKQIMVWTFMGSTRMYQAHRDYGNRISQVGLCSFKVKATGEIYESGVPIVDGSNMRTYISKWPRIKWLLTVQMAERTASSKPYGITRTACRIRRCWRRTVPKPLRRRSSRGKTPSA